MKEEEIDEIENLNLDLSDIDDLDLGLEVISYKVRNTIQEFANAIIHLQQQNKELQDRIENLNLIVSNKIIENYDIETPLKEELNKERTKNIVRVEFLEGENKELQDKLDEIKEYLIKEIEKCKEDTIINRAKPNIRFWRLQDFRDILSILDKKGNNNEQI